MKKVIKEVKKPTDITLLENVCVRKYYGFNINNSSPGYISGTDMLLYDKNLYQMRFFLYATEGNTWGGEFSNLKSCVEFALSDPDTNVFEFDTHQELFAWASKLK